jgi:ankyrin repeat protein
MFHRVTPLLASLLVSLTVAHLSGVEPAHAQADPQANFRANLQECRELSQRYLAERQSAVDRQLNVYLSQAAHKGCAELTLELLKDGASVRARRREGETALHHAVKATEPEVARILLEHGADLELRDLSGATPLFLAIEANRPKTVALLIARGANVNAPGRSAVAPIAAAAFNGNERIVNLLLDRGADATAADNTGKSAIVYAVARGFARIAERLLAAGVDVNARYGHGLTALMWAAGHANDVPERDGLSTTELLLSRGARLDQVDDRGRTALMMAAELGHIEIIKLLLARGADADARDLDGKTAADLADPAVRPSLAGR